MAGPSASSFATKNLSRSVYLSRLRRAFLLQAHPDRFRTQPPNVQRQQAELLQAIAGRLAQPDVLHYYQNQDYKERRAPNYVDYFLICGKKKVEQRLIAQRLNLNDSVSGIVQSLRDALKDSGHPFPSPPQEKINLGPMKSKENNGGIAWVVPPNNKHQSGKIDHRYDINSNQGRDFISFMESIDPWEIEKLRANRMDVVTAAFMVREAFSFSSVDGTGLGWSSAAVARLFRTLLALHQEHSKALSLSSFYPLQLVWTSVDHTTKDISLKNDSSSSLDLYGGILYLSPSSTPIQWLDHHLRCVTSDQLELHSHYKSKLKEYSDIVDRVLGVKFVKGNSCSSQNYHQVMKRLSDEYVNDSNATAVIIGSSSTLTLERVFCRVESSAAVRRGAVTNDGQIQISDCMTTSQIAVTIAKLLPKARQRLLDLRKLQVPLREEIIPQLQQEFGILKIQKGRTISFEQHVTSLSRLLQHLRTNNTNGDYDDSWKQKLAGNALNIVGKGRHCHLGDGGTLQIPWDWK